MLRVGKVSSVDTTERTARVIFEDRQDMVSAPLKVLSNTPVISVAITTSGAAWDMSQSYASVPRKDVANASYKKKPPDTIHGELLEKLHSVDIKVLSWLPYVGQTVVCIMVDNGDGDGFVIGGI